MDHAKCAAFELPFGEGEGFGGATNQGAEKSESDGAGDAATERAEMTAEALSLLEEEGAVRLTGGRWYWSDEGYPSEKISLRSATADNIVIIDVTGGGSRVIGEMDRPSAKELIFDNAVYIHLGTQFIVKKLDIANKICHVERKDMDYWTDAVVKTDIEVLTEDERSEPAASKLFGYALGDVLVRSQAEKFKKLRFHTHENVGFGEIFLPAEEMQTRSFMLLFPKESAAGSYLDGFDPAAAAAILVGTARLLQSLAPAFVLCDPRDIGVSERVRDPHFSIPAIYLYDKYPGGTGLSEALAVKLGALMTAALERLEGCPCGDGCPSCIGADLVGESVSIGAGGPRGGKVAGSSGYKAPVRELLARCCGH